MDIYGEELEEQFWFKTFQASFQTLSFRTDLEWIRIKKNLLLDIISFQNDLKPLTEIDTIQKEHMSQSK